MTEAEYRELHAKVDSEAIRNHEAIDRIWTVTNPGKSPPAGAWQSGNGLAPSQPANSVKAGALSGFPFTEAAKKIIDSFEGEFSQPHILERLRKAHPQLESKVKSGQLGVQISGVLSRFRKQGLIELIKKGTSNIPHVYKKTAKWGEKE